MNTTKESEMSEIAGRTLNTAEEKEKPIYSPSTSISQVNAYDLSHLLNLGDPMKSIKIKYAYRVKFAFYLIFSFANLLFCYPSYFLTSLIDNTDVERWFLLSYFLISLVVCIVFSVYVWIKSTSQKQTFRYTLNRTFGIRTELIQLQEAVADMKDIDATHTRSIYDIDQIEYVPLLMIVSFMWCCVVNIETLAAFGSNQCLFFINDTEPTCFAISNFAGGYFCVATWGIFLCIQHIECQDIIEKERKKIEKKYDNVAATVDRIHQRLKEWKDSKKLSNRKYEIFLTILFLCALTVYIFSVSRRNVWRGGYKWYILAVGFFNILCDCAVLCAVLIPYHTIIFYHYYFFYFIMDELAVPINAQSAYDIVGWWELRKYYIYCVVRIYSKELGVLIAGACTGSIVCITGLFIGTLENVVAIVATVWTITAVFVFATQAVMYQTSQMQHLSTINKERLAFDVKELVAYKNNSPLLKEEMRINHQIIDRIVIDIEKNTHPISVLGVRLDTNFMLFLRASTITLAIAFFMENL